MHTPGPWRLDDKTQIAADLIEGHYHSIEAGCGYLPPDKDHGGFSLTGYMPEADARLIAAAPDLLAALKCFLQDERFDVAVGGNPIAVDAMLKQARDAVSKAEGSDA